MGNAITIVTGDNTPQLKRITYDFDPVRGYIIYIEYIGASQAQMLILQQQQVANGIACRLIYENDKAELEIHDATQSYAIDTWQILGNEEDIDLFSHPTVLSVLGNYTAAGFTATDIMSAIREGLSQDQSWDNVQFPSGQDLSPGDDATLEQFYILYQKGAQNFQRQQYSIHHTCNVSNRWAGQDAFTTLLQKDINCIYTPAQFLSEAGSSFWAYPLPQRMITEIQNIPALTPSGGASGYLWGFKKSPPTEVTAANNRIDVSQEYILELWSTVLYPIAT